MTIISVIVPCRNEQKYIEAFVKNIFSQKLDINHHLEVVIADGLSNDGTFEILTRLTSQFPDLKVIQNEKGIVSCGLNKAISNSSGEIIIRMDVHTEYSDEYINQCKNIIQQIDADCVGGAWMPGFKGRIQKIISVIFSSRFLSGGALSRSPFYSGYVDTVYLGAWNRSIFTKYGLFDESLIRNQDDEFCLRIKKGGGKIFQSSSIKSIYYPRSSWPNLAKQYFQYGFWKPAILRKHGLFGATRHWLILLISMLSPFFVGLIYLYPIKAFSILFLFVVIYFLVVGFSVIRKLNSFSEAFFVAPFYSSAYHFGYIFGMSLGLISIFVPILKKIAKSLTR